MGGNSPVHLSRRIDDHTLVQTVPTAGIDSRYRAPPYWSLLRSLPAATYVIRTIFLPPDAGGAGVGAAGDAGANAIGRAGDAYTAGSIDVPGPVHGTIQHGVGYEHSGITLHFCFSRCLLICSLL